MRKISKLLFALGVKRTCRGAAGGGASVISIAAFINAFLLLSCYGEHFFEVEPGDTSVLMGESFTLYCRVVNKTGVTYWAKDNATFAVPGEGQSPASDRWAVFGDPGGGEYNLQIREAQKMDEGSYTCRSTSAQKSENDISSDVAVVKVMDPPNPGAKPICLTSKTGNLVEGDPVDFTCAFAIDPNGDNATTLSWERTGPRENSLAALPFSALVDREEYVVRKMTVTVTTDDHLATYTCTARHESGEGANTTCSTGSLLVQHVPIVEMEPGSVDSVLGANVRFSCVLDSAYPKDVTYEWYHGGQMLDPSTDGRFELQNVTNGMIITILGLIDSDDGALIICAVRNSVGTGTARAVIKLPERPFDLERDILIWLIPLGVIGLLMLLAIFLAIFVLDCHLLANCCDKRKNNAQGPQTRTWSMANLAMTVRAQSLADLDDEYFITRSIRSRSGAGIRPDTNTEDRKIPLSEGQVNPNFILESRQGTTEREKQLKTRSERDRMRSRGIENEYDDATVEVKNHRSLTRVNKQQDSPNVDSGLSSSRESHQDRSSPTLQRLGNNVKSKKEIYAAVERENLGLERR